MRQKADNGPLVPQLPWEGHVRYECTGDPAKAVYMLSGLGVTARVWHRAFNSFRTSGATVVAESLAGHDGCKKKFSRVTRQQWYRAAESELLRLYENGGQPVVLAGFSAGALLAILLTIRNPKAVRMLLLTGYCPKIENVMKRGFLNTCGFAHAFVPPLRPLLRLLSFSAEGSTRPDLLTEEYLEQPRFARFSFASILALMELQVLAEAGILTTSCPVHFFHGRHDRRTGVATVEATIRSMEQYGQTGVKLHVFEQSAHCVPLGPEGEAFTKVLCASAAEAWM